MKSFADDPRVLNGLIYLKISKNEVNAYGDMESLVDAEAEQKTGRLFDYSITPEEWATADYTARVVDGKLFLGLPQEAVLARQKEAIRNERNIRLRKCDKMSPMHWNALTDTQKQEWTDYRIALLNVPQQEGFPWGGDIDKVPWPVEPDS